MAYYCLITGVTRGRPTGYTVAYDVLDDGPTPDAVIDSGSVGLTFDRQLLDPTITVAEKRRFIIDQLEAHFRAHIDEIRAGDAAFSQIAAALEGRRYPAA